MKFQLVFAVFKKEMRRFLFDKRMLCALFLPGVMIFVLYTILGQVIDSVFTNLGVEPDYSYKIAINEEGKNAEFEATLLTYFSQTEQAAPTIEYYTVDLSKMRWLSCVVARSTRSCFSPSPRGS